MLLKDKYTVSQTTTTTSTSTTTTTASTLIGFTLTTMLKCVIFTRFKTVSTTSLFVTWLTFIKPIRTPNFNSSAPDIPSTSCAVFTPVSSAGAVSAMMRINDAPLNGTVQRQLKLKSHDLNVISKKK